MDSKNKWDNRYSKPDFIYGLQPNEFLKQELLKLQPGSVLLPGEGEGRNALWAAQQGWEVTALDSSSVAQQKALGLLAQNNVTANYHVSDILHFECTNQFDAIGLIYLHLHKSIQQQVAEKIVSLLKPKGWLILEVFDPKQIPLSSGGPKSLELFSTIKDLRILYKDLNIEHIDKHNIKLNEGTHHKGQAIVIRMLASKP